MAIPPVTPVALLPQGTQTITLHAAPVVPAAQNPAPAVVHLVLRNPLRAEAKNQQLAPVAPPKPMPQRTLLSIILNLGTILVKYGTKNDLLAMNLMVTGHTFMTYVLTNIRQPVDTIIKGGIEKINQIKEVLKNPHGVGMFVDPWINDKGVTMEKSNMEKYAADSLRFTGRNIVVIPNEFAKEVINWINSLQLETLIAENQLIVAENPNNDQNRALIPENQAPVPVVLSQEIIDYQNFMGYESYVNQTVVLREKIVTHLADFEKKLEQIEHLEAIRDSLQQDNVQLFNRYQGQLARMEQNGLERTAELTRSINAIRDQQQETLTIYQQINDEAMEKLRKVEADLREANIQMTRQQQQISSLCYQLNCCYAQLGHLQNELNNQSSCSVM